MTVVGVGTIVVGNGTYLMHRRIGKMICRRRCGCCVGGDGGRVQGAVQLLHDETSQIIIVGLFAAGSPA